MLIAVNRWIRVGAALLPLLCATAGAASDPSSDEVPQTIRVATWNVEWFFDDFKPNNRSDIAKQQSAPSRAEYDWKKNQIARVIAALEPDIIALHEVEDREVIFQLTKELESAFQLKYRYAFIEGFDFGTEQDVALLYKSGLVEYSRCEQTSEQAGSDRYYSIAKHLFPRFVWGSGSEAQELLVGIAHFRAAPEQEALRVRQGRLMHSWVADRIARGENVILMGDFNSERDCMDDDPKGDIGVLRGLETPDTGDDLTILNRSLPEALRVTHLSGRQYDLILASPSLMQDDPARKNFVFSRIVTRADLVIVGERDANHFDGYYQIPRDQRDISDHYPLMAEFVLK